MKLNKAVMDPSLIYIKNNHMQLQGVFRYKSDFYL
jgi:hypothetical protein